MVVIGDPLDAGQTSTEADCVLLVDSVAGLVVASHIEGEYAVDDSGRWIRLVDLSNALAPI